jgi:hypothetical protein
VIDRIHETDALGYIIKPIHESDLEIVSQKVLEGNEPDETLDRGELFLSWVETMQSYLDWIEPSGPALNPQGL